MKQIYIALYDSGIFRAGEAINAAVVYILNNHGSLGQHNARQYIWFGDPAQNVWTFDTPNSPSSLAIDAPAWVNPGNQNIIVHVMSGGNPVDSVLVTLTDGVDGYGAGMTFYARGMTDAGGMAAINADVPATGIINVGAFRHDYHFDLDSIIIQVGISVSHHALPGAFSLDSPVPNPVVEAASFSFNLPVSGLVELAVYDISGRRIDILLDAEVEAGAHSVGWRPGESISSGVYFVRLTAAEGIITRQVMLVR